MGGEVVFVLIVVVVMLAIEPAEMGLSNSTHDTSSLAGRGNYSDDHAGNLTKNLLQPELDLVRKIHPVFSPSYLLEGGATISNDGSITREEKQDGLRNLGVPLVCAAVSLMVFGIILFIKKFAQSDNAGGSFADENENFVVNGDDIIYHWSGVECDLYELEDREHVCRCDGVNGLELTRCDETSSY